MEAERGAKSLRAAPRERLRASALVFLLATVGLACGGPTSTRVPVGADGRPIGARVERRYEPADLFPADLDLVVRVDVARMNAAIGPSAAREVAQRAGIDGARGDELLAAAVGRAKVVWIGLRLTDIEAGDRIVVVEGDVGDLRLEAPIFRPVEIDAPGVSIVERAEAPPRAGTERVIRLGDRAAAFVSPIEVDSVARVLREGPDERRGDPAREGIFSLDLRPRRLPASLEQRFPSIGAVIAGIRRVRAAAMPVDEGVRIDAEITARNKASAERALRFLTAVRDNVEGEQSKELMRGLSIEEVEDAVRVRWLLTPKVLATLVKEAPSSR